MSRIGRKPVAIPEGVKVTVDGQTLTVEGAKGSLTRSFHPNMTIEVKDGHILVSRCDDEKENRSLHGLTRALIANMVRGVTEGYKKELEVIGVGYHASKDGENLKLGVGYSHPVIYKPHDGVTITVVEAKNRITVSGTSKEAVGQAAAEIRAKRPPEPYQGKGIRYVGEHVRHKDGKAGKK